MAGIVTNFSNTSKASIEFLQTKGGEAIGGGIAFKTALEMVDKINQRLSGMRNRREIRRSVLRKNTEAVEDNMELSTFQSDTKKENLAKEYVQNSLEDNLSETNIIEDLSAAGTLPSGTSQVYLVTKMDLQAGIVPTIILPPSRCTFQLHLKHENGTAKVIGNPLQGIGLPVQFEEVSPKNYVSSKESGPKSSTPFANILDTSFSTFGVKTKEKITMLDLKTNSIHVLEKTEKNQEVLQGIDPNEYFDTYTPRPTLSAIAVQTAVFLGFFSLIGLPFLKNLQKKIVNLIFEEKKKNKKEKKDPF